MTQTRVCETKPTIRKYTRGEEHLKGERNILKERGTREKREERKKGERNTREEDEKGERNTREEKGR